MPLPVRILTVDLFRRPLRARLPFRFGAVTVRDLTQLVARVRITSDDATHTGHAADFAVPRWFRKDPARSLADDVRDLTVSVRLAAASWLRHGRHPRPAFATWLDVYRERVDFLPRDHPDRLTRGFGVALVERAVLDAACHTASVSFFAALQRDLFGFEPWRALPELRSYHLAADLPAEPLERVTVRHTVGMLDPLRIRDLPASDRVDDGLPETLDEYVQAHDLTHFKIKVGQGIDPDRARLIDIARTLRPNVSRPSISLDGNEQYRDTREVLRLLDTTARDPDGAWLLEGLLYVEQPLRRELTFDPAHNSSITSAPAPFVIDEADTGIDAFARAFDLGYRGVSAKSCKGVFRALVNRGVAGVRGGFQCAEDLTTLPVLALQQDLALIGALGIGHAERNGHHYFRGLDHLSPAAATRALTAHPDLYESWSGGVRLAIRAGALSLASFHGPGFGAPSAIDLDALELLRDESDAER